MSIPQYLDGDTLDHCQQALRDGRTLDHLAGLLHMDCEYLGRLLGLPTSSQPAQQQDDAADFLWRADALDGVL